MARAHLPRISGVGDVNCCVDRSVQLSAVCSMCVVQLAASTGANRWRNSVKRLHAAWYLQASAGVSGCAFVSWTACDSFSILVRGAIIVMVGVGVGDARHQMVVFQ